MSVVGKALRILSQRPKVTADDLALALWPKFVHGGEKMRKKAVEAASLLLARLRKVPAA